MLPIDGRPQQGSLRTMQLIAIGILLGLTTFLVLVLFLVYGAGKGQGPAPPARLPVISLVAVIMLATSVPLGFVLAGVQTRAALRRIAAGTRLTREPGSTVGPSDLMELLTVRQTTMLIALALLEGAAFMGCIAFLIEKQPFVLAAVLVALALMLAQFPTEGRVRAWLERQAGQLAAMRQRGEAVTP